MTMLNLKVKINYHDGVYWARSEEVEGCFSDGKTILEALENYKEAWEFHFEDEEVKQPESFIPVIKEIFDDFGVSVTVVANRLKFSRSWLSQRLNGIVPIKPEELKKIQDELHKIGRELTSACFV